MNIVGFEEYCTDSSEDEPSNLYMHTYKLEFRVLYIYFCLAIKFSNGNLATLPTVDLLFRLGHAV